MAPNNDQRQIKISEKKIYYSGITDKRNVVMFGIIGKLFVY